jgi:hypothetical protein
MFHPEIVTPRCKGERNLAGGLRLIGVSVGDGAFFSGVGRLNRQTVGCIVHSLLVSVQPLYDAHNVRSQIAVTGYGIENLLSGSCGRPSAAVDVNGNRLDEYSIDLCLEPAETYIRRLMVSTCRGTSRPMKR